MSIFLLSLIKLFFLPGEYNDSLFMKDVNNFEPYLLVLGIRKRLRHLSISDNY